MTDQRLVTMMIDENSKDQLFFKLSSYLVSRLFHIYENIYNQAPNKDCIIFEGNRVWRLIKNETTTLGKLSESEVK